MHNYIKLKLIASALDNSNLKKIADKQKPKFDLQKALKASPQYWKTLSLSQYEKQIKQVLKTSAEPNSEEFVSAVYNYQIKNPNISLKDGILGEETFSAIIKDFPDIFKGVSIESMKQIKPFSRQVSPSDKSSPKAPLPFDPQGKTGKQISEFATEIGFLNLRNHGIPTKNFPFVVPELVRMLKTLESQGIDIAYVSEAWPATSRHQDPNHWNGRAIDFVLKNPKQHSQASAICRSFGFDVVDEYVTKTQFGTGAHIHVDLGSLPSITDKNKMLAWEKHRQQQALV